MSRIQELFHRKNNNILNIYFTAGYPNMNDTATIIEQLQAAGADIVEIGMPYSDPLADGTTIQESGTQALINGMKLPLLFQQLQNIRATVHIPLIMMGYFNQLMQFGVENFCLHCKNVGIDALILPDLPMDIYEEEYQAIFDKYQLKLIFLITPQTSDARIKKVDSLSNGFIYMVSNAATTGAKTGISEAQKAYFQRVNNMQLNNPRLIGFGISDNDTFSTACKYASGAIIGSAFIRHLSNKTSEQLPEVIHEFVNMVLDK